ncbi:hypothetical protein BIU82_10770 [Arthrobacter sp. SW1]|uniref:hypothetical protein n=1 Tax=Arthrobacter sp. SW1 TaxID=1920889 RepID=UPI000877D7A3|nr:hypothetical protein [Arthrobacter sp. SW1]OFI36903.1 hypothetical protein BIU82_10770 [Arthrobacter sp. SW1]
MSSRAAPVLQAFLVSRMFRASRRCRVCRVFPVVRSRVFLGFRAFLVCRMFRVSRRCRVCRVFPVVRSRVFLGFRAFLVCRMFRVSRRCRVCRVCRVFRAVRLVVIRVLWFRFLAWVRFVLV